MRGKLAELAKTLTSERAAYPDLYGAAVEQYKQSTEFQIAMDTVVATSLARGEGGEAGPSTTAVVELIERQTRAEIIENFQRSDYYKHQLSIYWDSGLVSFQQRAGEAFLDIDFTLIKPGEGDVAQTSLDEGVKEEEDLVSSEEEGD